MPEGYEMNDKEKENIKKQYSYTTSDTKYILPSDFCTMHTVTEVIPPEVFSPGDIPEELPEEP